MIHGSARSRGQTELLGYILIFSVVLLSIGSIYLTGIGSLNSYQATFELNNAEQAMLIFSSNVEDITQHASPRRSVEIKTSDGAIETTTHYNVTIAVGNTDSLSTSIRGFAYRGNAGDVVYVAGALLRSQHGGASMQKTPPFRFHKSENRVLLDVVRLAGQAEYRGSGTALAVLHHDEALSTTNYSAFGTSRTVTITIETPPNHAQAWQDYFKTQGLEDVGYNSTTGTVKGNFTETDELLIRSSVIWVRIEE